METESQQPKPEPCASVAEPIPALGATGIKRRALLRAGASATPVLLTLGSGPVSAGMMPCTVASSFVSARTFASRNAQTTTMTCSSMNAANWNKFARDNCGGDVIGNNWAAWAKQTVRDHLSISSTADYDSECVGWIMKGRNKDGADCAEIGQLAVLQLILALTLTMQYNAGSIQTATSTGGQLSKSYLATVWTQYRTSGTFTVAGSVAWNEAAILRWLRLLQNNIAVSSMFT